MTKNIPNCIIQEERKDCLVSEIKDHSKETIGKLGILSWAASDCFPALSNYFTKVTWVTTSYP